MSNFKYERRNGHIFFTVKNNVFTSGDQLIHGLNSLQIPIPFFMQKFLRMPDFFCIDKGARDFVIIEGEYGSEGYENACKRAEQMSDLYKSTFVNFFILCEAIGKYKIINDMGLWFIVGTTHLNNDQFGSILYGAGQSNGKELGIHSFQLGKYSWPKKKTGFLFEVFF